MRFIAAKGVVPDEAACLKMPAKMGKIFRE